MKTNTLFFIVLIFALAALLLQFYYPQYAEKFKQNLDNNDFINKTINKTPANTSLLPEYLTIANWNLQIFGQDKASNATLMAAYAGIISQYDIIFIQEIRDSSGTAFPALCTLLPEYECINSSRAGTSSSKEQYGLIYRRGLLLREVRDYNYGANMQLFERPPIAAVFEMNIRTIESHPNVTIWVIHTKPEAAGQELANLEMLIGKSQNVNGKIIVIGDTNYACSYVTKNEKRPFAAWDWVISDDADTTVSPTTCAYDRIITNFVYSQAGIYTNITKDMSDHYLVWVKI